MLSLIQLYDHQEVEYNRLYVSLKRPKSSKLLSYSQIHTDIDGYVSLLLAISVEHSTKINNIHSQLSFFIIHD